MFVVRSKLYKHLNVKAITKYFDVQRREERSFIVSPCVCETIQRKKNKLQTKRLSTQVGKVKDTCEESSSWFIGNNPQKDPSWYSEDEKRKAKNIPHLLRLAWEDYKSTWEGFNDNLKKKSKTVEQEDDDKENDSSNNYQINTDKFVEKQKEIRSNVDRNLGVLREEGASLVDIVKGMTGINNKRDLKVFAMEQLKLANECVSEFMKGYRFGRDKEFEKVMTEYFKDIEFNDEVDGSTTKSDDSNEVDPDDGLTREIIRRRRRKSKQIIKTNKI